MRQTRRSNKRNTQGFDEEKRQLELHKLREEITSIKSRNENYHLERFEGILKVIVSLGVIAIAAIGYYYSEPFFAIKKKEYDLKVDSIQSLYDSLNHAADFLKTDLARLHSDNSTLKDSINRQQLFLRALTDTVSNLSDFTPQEVEQLIDFYQGLLIESESKSIVKVSEDGFISPLRRAELLYSANFPQWTPYEYIFSRYNKDITWFKIIDEPNIYAPYNGIVTAVDTQYLPSIEVKCKNYYIKFYGLNRPFVSKGQEFVIREAIGIASLDYRLGLIRSVGIEVLDSNRKLIPYPFIGIVPLEDNFYKIVN